MPRQPVGYEETDAGLLRIKKYEVTNMYVCRRREDWPVFRDDKFQLGGHGESMLRMTEEEARSLELVRVFCDMKKERAGEAVTWNWKKVSLVRAEWKTTAVKDRNLTPKARAVMNGCEQTTARTLGGATSTRHY